MFNPTEKELVSLWFSSGSLFINNYSYEKIVWNTSIKKWLNGWWQISFSPSCTLTVEINKEQDIHFLVADIEAQNKKAKKEEIERIVGILDKLMEENKRSEDACWVLTLAIREIERITSDNQ